MRKRRREMRGREKTERKDGEEREGEKGRLTDGHGQTVAVAIKCRIYSPDVRRVSTAKGSNCTTQSQGNPASQQFPP